MSDAPARPPVVLAFGLRPERLFDSEGRIDCFLEAPAADQIHTVVEALRSGLDAGDAVIAIVPDRFPAEGLRRLETARALLRSDRVPIHVTGLPPLAGSVLCSLASVAGQYAPSAGVVASMLPALEAELHIVTWLATVSGLGWPAPSIGQHVASLAPGTAFAVSSFPEPAVHRLSARDATVPLPPITRPSRLAVAAGSADAGWVLGPMNAELGDLEVRQVESTPAGPDYWGTDKLVEAVAYPIDVEALVGELLSASEIWDCRWCGEPVARTPCPMCGHRGGPARRRPVAG